MRLVTSIMMATITFVKLFLSQYQTGFAYICFSSITK